MSRPPGIPAGALIGRDNEMALLTGLLSGADRGNSVLIEGEPGIGKSALVRAAVAKAPEAGWQVFWGAGDELGQALPLLPFLDGLRVRDPSATPRRTAIAGLLCGEITAGRGTDVSALLAEHLLALITEQCAMRPTVLVIDDLQWADLASIALWGRLARSAQQVPLLLIGMMRPVPLREDLLALRRAVGDQARLQLEGLAGTAVADLVAALAGGRPDSSLLRLADGAAGNPRYLTELVAALASNSSLAITGAGEAGPAADPSRGPLSAAIADCLGFLAGPVREVLRAAALLGSEFAVPDLAVVLGRNVTDLVPAIREALVAGVLADSGESLGFRHQLIRAALSDEMPGPARAAWHREAARALAEAGVPPDRVARQLLQALAGSGTAAGPVNKWMLTWLDRAADSLVGRAPAVAAELLARAVDISPARSARHGRLVSRLADALCRCGDLEGAEQVAGRALERVTEPDLVVDLHWTLAQCRMRAGLSAESLAAALASLNGAMAAPGIAARHRARLLVLAAQWQYCAGDAGMAGQAAASALAAAEEAGDNLAAGWALHVLALVAAGGGRAADALPLFDRALAAAHADPVLADLRLALLVDKGLALGSLDRYEQAFGAVAQARHIADQGGAAGRQARVHGALAWLLFQTGRWDEALAEVAVIPENPWEPGAARGEHAIATVISFHRGDTGAARRHLAAAGAHSGPARRRLPGPFALARSLDREQDGALPEALAELADAFVGGSGEEPGAPEDLFADAVRLAVRTGDLATGRAVAARAVALADGSQVPHRQANALYCGGLLDHDATRLLAAAELYEDAGWPLLSATALEAAAGEFVRDGDRGKGRDAFNRAAEIYASLDADADAARLLADFRAHGIRRGPHSRHRRAQTGWDSLTPTEIKIAGFVEGGLSNPDIAARMLLSGRTVATHVSHILKKLGVHSRTDIARESALRGVASRGLPGPEGSGTPAGSSWPGLREAWPHGPDVVPRGAGFRDRGAPAAAAV